MTHKMASTSLAAYHTLDLNELEQMVFDVIEAYGSDGCISDQVRAMYPSLSYSSVTARFSSLEVKGAIYRAGDTRPGESGRGQQVMRVIKHIETVPLLPKPTKINPFLKGLVFAAKIVIKAENLKEARKSLANEIRRMM